MRSDYLANQTQRLIGDGTVNNIVVGVITRFGPSSEADDTTQSRYWIKPQRPDPSLSAGDSLTLLDENIPEASTIFRATNLGEEFTSHLLATDETVYVILYNVTYDCFPTVTHWFFSLPPPQWIRVRIGSATQDGSNKRWKYDWTEYNKATAGYGGWSSLSGGRSGHNSTWGYAYNMVEDGNGASGTYGNGVQSSNLTGTIDIQKVPADQVIVLASIVYPLDGSLPELWFSYENGIDGACP